VTSWFRSGDGQQRLKISGRAELRRYLAGRRIKQAAMGYA